MTEEDIAIVKSYLPGQELSHNEIEDAYAEAGTFRGAAALLWRKTAAKYANLVDVQEGSSSRKLSQLYQHALAMAAQFDTAGTDGLSGMRPARTRRIVRDAG